MKGFTLRTMASGIAIAAFALAGAQAFAQDASAEAPAEEQAFGDEIVVTAAPGDKSKLRSSISVTDISDELIERQAPRSEAEVYKLIPGIRAESTAGPGGNSNITVRGLPLASGGSKYVQIQEDGIAVVEYGDIAFGNNDYWTRYDWTVDTVQAVRGGSSSTLASQAPGAVINYVSKTGERAGGAIGLTTGLGYDEKRLDFNYGSPITDTLRFNVGGFYRTGKGPRDIGYNAIEGYQIKANVTQEFADNKGFIRLYFKKLDDRSPTYTASPFGVTVDGDKVTGYYALSSFDSRKDSNFSNYNLTFPTIDADGSIKQGSNKEGIHVKVNSFGAQLHYEVSDAITLDDRFALSNNKGVFSAPFYGSLSTIDSLIAGYSVTTSDNVTYTAATARYANGANAGQAVASGTVVDQHPNLYTDMNDMSHVGNDLGLTGKFAVGGGDITARLGYYYSRQTIDMAWHWNASIKTAGTDPVLIDLYAADGTKLTDNGLTGYNNQWGACCARNYNLDYTDNAPYLSLNYADDKLDLDASIRRDSVQANGEFFGTASGPVAVDVNGDGVLSVAERNSYLAKITNPQIVNYKVDYTNWSAGANYRVTPDLSVFIRASKGHRANADRVVSDFSGQFTSAGDLTALGEAVAVNPVTQQELGLKTRTGVLGGNLGVNVTAFRSQATEYNYDLTNQQQTFQKYKTWGVELESLFKSGGFMLNANLVYMHSRIAEDLISGNTGNTPRATPDWSWTVAPSYDFGIAAVGLTMVGQTSTYANDDNLLKQRGQNIFSAFVRFQPVEGLDLSVNANNLFNSWDQAGRLDQGTVAGLASTGALFGVPYAGTNRVGLGRTFTGSIKYRF